MSEYVIPQALGRQGPQQFFRAVQSPDPGAGTEVAWTIPAGKIWVIRGIRFTFTTDATVANRRSGFTVEFDGQEIYRHRSAIQQAASLAILYQWYAGLGFEDAAAILNTIKAGIPSFVLSAGHVIRTLTDTIQAGDDYGAAWAHVVEYEMRGQSAAIAFELAQMLAEQLDLEALTESMLRRR